MKLVFDTSAVIYLMEKWGLAQELLALTSRYELLIPQRVREEFLNGEVGESDKGNIEKVFRLVPVSLKEELLPYFNFDSRDGAIWVMSYVKSTPHSRCVIDEAFGRSVCETMGVACTGSIGVLRLMVKEGLLAESRVEDIRTRIRKSSFYHKDWLLDKISE